ncbi:hypothetical protein D932_03137, partial [Enterococcus casseliflavus 14-MB-W-14]
LSALLCLYLNFLLVKGQKNGKGNQVKTDTRWSLLNSNRILLPLKKKGVKQMQAEGQTNSTEEKFFENIFPIYKIFSLCFFALAIYHMTSWQVLADEGPTDQSQGVLADILNSER